jgi:hypothetical protein
MTKFFLSFLIIAASFAACSKNESKVEKATIEYFRIHLKADMDFTAIQNLFGQPDADLGSGIHIYVYQLKDGTAIWIGYANKIMYARHIDGNNQLISNLV